MLECTILILQTILIQSSKGNIREFLVCGGIAIDRSHRWGLFQRVILSSDCRM